ncbi:hypothetical protein PSTT_02392 [Puccinia striiformis]|uniref:Peptidase A1 domain-containing protein n=1 Tax=Puccinia striiformis TaxID=27350 RepID=A0A2S4VZZ3_9BASI|nr:hypothetical protein PSTT_02392 [Puccinia striiformis]
MFSRRVPPSSLATFNMTPYQLEDMYKSGSVPLITSDGPAVANKTDDSEPPLSSLRAVNQPNTIPITSSRPSHRGSTMPLDNLLSAFGFQRREGFNLGSNNTRWQSTEGFSCLSRYCNQDAFRSEKLIERRDKCLISAGPLTFFWRRIDSMHAQPTNKSYEISFGDGSSVKADLMTDTVSEQSHNLALNFKAQPGTPPMGKPINARLSSRIIKSEATPFFTALTKTSDQQGVMGSRFSRKSDVGSEITIGGVNPAAFVGPFTTLNVMAMEGQPPAFWDVTFDGAIVNGQRLQLSSTIATIDTGTSVIGVPQEDARAIYASVPGAASSGGGQYTYPCQSIPFVSLVFGGRKFDINPADSSSFVQNLCWKS